MTLWVCKGGKRGERESRFKEYNLIAIGFNLLDDLSKIKTRDELKPLYEKAWPDASEGRKNNHVGQLYAFLTKVKIGDLVVVPMKTNGTIWIGEITSEYVFQEKLGSDMKHTRKVKWLKKDLPRSSFDRAVLYSFGSAMTLSRAQKHDAEGKVRILAKRKAKPGHIEHEDSEVPEGEELPDLEELAKNQLTDYVSQRFKGHELAWLISGILEARGFKTVVSPPGPDGGVDISASSGSLGLSEPRMCVQVKSQQSPVDVRVYRELRDTMNKIGATHGLLVSWGGFKRSVYQESKDDVFFIQLWGSKEIIEELLGDYQKLPAEIKTTVPLKRIWIMTESEEGE